MKIKHLLIGMLAMAATVACQPDQPADEAKLEVSTEAVALEATAAEATFEVTSNNDWTATADADWVTLDPASGAGAAEAVTVKVTAEDNETTEARTATVTVKSGELTKTVALTQAGSEPAPELPTPNVDWTSDAVVSYDLPESASSKRQLLKNIKYTFDENYLYVKLQASAAEFAAAPAEYLGIFVYDVTDGSGDGYYGWWNDAKGNVELEGEHIGVFSGKGITLTIGETPVEVVTEENGDELVWTMNILRSAHENLALENPHFAFLTYIGWEPNGALPDKYENMLQFTPAVPEPIVKVERGLVFAAATAEAVLGQEFTAPALNGETAGVVYTSSNTAVATVDAATGAVTLVAAGETTITAAAEENETHLAGSASYTLTVVEPAPAVSTIASVLALGNGATVPADTFVEGVVISNMDLNNLTSKKGLYIQDETAGLQFYLAANHTYKFGDKVKVDLSGAKVGAYNGAVQISGLALEKIEVLSSGNAVTAKTVTIDDFLANKYEGQYVAIEGVQVASADLSKTFVMGGAHTSINVENADGKKFVVFSSKYATYGATAVPQGSGTLMGISSINNGNMQLIFAQTSDFAGLTGERFGQGAVEPEPEPEQPEQPETPAASNRADFETLTKTASYTAHTTTDGWVLTNCAVQEGYTTDINPQYILIGKVEGTDTWAKAACMNGKTSAVGSIESPELSGGCGTLSFDFAHIFSDKNGMDFNIEVIQGGAVVKTINVKKTADESVKMTKLHFSEEVNVSGSFKLKFTNNCPSKTDGNKDRVSIWNLTWTNVQ